MSPSAIAPPGPQASDSTAAPGSLTRSDILRAGQTTSPWIFVPVAEQVLAQQPGDDDVRFLLIRHLLTLQLRTAAIEQIGCLSARARTDPRVLDSIKSINALADDRISFRLLEATCRANVDALATHPTHPVNLRLHLAVWAKRAPEYEWFRAMQGNIVRRKRGPDGVAQWIGFDNARAGAQQYRYQSDPNATGPARAAAPIVVEGVDPPWLLERVCAEHVPAADGYSAPITVLQADPLELLDGLAQTDLTGRLREPRLRVMVGPNAGDRFAEDLLRPERLDCALTGPVLTGAMVRTRVSPAPARSIEHAAAVQDRTRETLTEDVLRRYAARGAGHHARRFGAREPLRVLIITCRYSTFVKHSAADLGAALEGLGHSVRTVIEPDDHSWLTPLATVRAIHEHDPDLLMMINYTRASFPGLYPPELPVLTWVQDAMPHLLSPEAGRAIGRSDFVIGNIFHEHTERFGYPVRQLMPATMVASARKFHDGPVDAALERQVACDIAYVSHHSQTPEALHERRTAAAADAPDLVRALNDLFPLTLRVARQAARTPLTICLRGLTTDVLRSHGLAMDESSLSRLMSTYTYPIADRALRHETLTWAADIAHRRGWTLGLFGRGWDKHPTLARLARPELAHGEALRACYRTARVHLQVTMYHVMHQRVVECVLCGGLPLLRLHADDLHTQQFHASSAAAARQAEPLACHLEYTALLREPVIGFRADEHAEGRRFEQFRTTMGFPSDGLVWIAQSHLPRARRSDLSIGGEGDLFWLLGEPERLMFASPEQLEDRLERAITDEDWRAEARSTLAQRSREYLTHDALARRTLDFIADRLTSP